MALQDAEPAAAATDNEPERAIDAVSECAKLCNMPVEPLAPAAARCELEGEDLDLGTFGDKVAPPDIIVLRACVDMQRSPQACGGHLRPGEQDPLHAVKIVGARHVRQHAVVRRADERDTERLQGCENRATFLQLPPAFDRIVLVNTRHDNGGAFDDAETIGKVRKRGDMRLAGSQIDELIERQRDHRLVKARHTPIAMINERHDRWQVRNAVRGNARRVLETQATHFAHARDEKARIESTDHVALALVLARAEVTAVEDARVGVNAATAIAFEAVRAAQRLRVLRRIVPKPLWMWEATRWFVGRPIVHFTLISAVSPNNPTRWITPSA
ncbi:hypothetical protein QCM80_10950 [Bradyrhizobium sp. SSUT112]|uniref:hypothetical protein n=1 Tax=Bradyrhizobium sp. SSUT112 TaxID=3040604 RepID=UPI00244BDADA|nr:hypothetical protein [Bradyrhizobium sp. SSUT112]MDH2351186.1 hypothetical protein [Bradyrhizobium sp. SSUT112]